MQTLSSLDRSEVLRYLGCRGNELSANMEDMVLRCIHEMCQAAKPAWLYRRFSVRRTEEGILLEPGSLLLAGKDIASHLTGCEEAFLLCATIGLSAERLIRTRMVTNPEEGVILDACATQAVEQTADLAEEEITELCQKEGHGLTWRFSPGYGDLPLAVQSDFIRVCDTPRRIGLTVTDSLLMTPGKSVTAILGVTPLPTVTQEERTDKCSRCPNQGRCAFRKREITC